MKPIMLYFLFCIPFTLAAQNTDLNGYIYTEDGAFVDQVEVRLFDDQGQLLATSRTTNGRYTFKGLLSGFDYTLQLSKEGDVLNGLSTFDFVVISRHLLAVEPLPSANLVLAADIDGSGSVSVGDLVYLRQLILGIIRELPQKRNWLFLAEDQTPAHPQSPNTFTFSLNNNLEERNFLILKIGDMNKTADFE